MSVSARRPYLLASIALHLLLGGGLYYFGTYQVEMRHQDEQVAASVQAASQTRTMRRVEDLQKIKELMEKSAMREPEPGSEPERTVSQDPRQQLEQARELARAIDEISRDIKVEEQARLTGMPKESVQAEMEAKEAAPPPSDEAKPVDPAQEIARLEQHGRAVLAQRAQELERKQQGVAVTASDAEGTGAQAEIADFMGEQGAGERSEGSSGPGFKRYARTSDRLVNFGSGQLPPVHTWGLVKSHGRMLGAGGQYANRINLHSWYLIGPFLGRDSKGAFRRHPPEDAVLLDAVYRGKDKRLLKWEYVNQPAYPLIPREHADDAIYYGYTEVWMDQERDLMLWLGVDDNVALYLNDRQIWQSEYNNKGWFFEAVYKNRQGVDRHFNRTEAQKIVRFKKGRNRIFFKLYNEHQEMFFSMVLTLPPQR